MPQDHPDGTVPMQITGADKKLPIDHQDQNKGMYLQPEWAAKEGTDKNFTATVQNKTRDQYTYVTYQVPSGKTLYVTGVSFWIYSNAAADYDHFFYGSLVFKEGPWDEPGTHKGYGGGVGGGILPFTKPIEIVASEYATAMIYNRSNVAANLAVSFWGYEL